jgi:hypothetical protein
MKKLTDEEINIIWTSELSFRELVQAAYERGYQDAVINNDNGLRRLVKDMNELDSNEERDAMWYEYQKNRNR